MPRFGSILPVRNKLVYPFGTSSGFDEEHIALASGGTCRFSAITSGGSFISLLNGRAPDSVGSGFSGAVFGAMPLTQNVTSAAAVSFSTKINFATDTVFTIATIFYINQTSTNNVLLTFGLAGTNGNGVRVGTGINGLSFVIAATATASGLGTPSLNVPYFVVIGRTGTGTNQAFGLLLNLNTGSVKTSTTTVSTAAVTPTEVDFGAPSGGAYRGGVVAGAYIGGGSPSLQMYQAWANDPFSFWFPATPIDWVGKIVAATRMVPLRMRMGVGQ